MSGKRPAEPGVGGPEPKRLRGPDGALQVGAQRLPPLLRKQTPFSGAL